MSTARSPRLERTASAAAIRARLCARSSRSTAITSQSPRSPRLRLAARLRPAGSPRRSRGTVSTRATRRRGRGEGRGASAARGSDLREKHVEVGGRADADIVSVFLEEDVRGKPTLLLQHVEERGFRVELGGAERSQLVSDDAV